MNKSDTEPTVETFDNTATQAMDSIFGEKAPSCGTSDLFHFPRPRMLSQRMSLNVDTYVAFRRLNSALKTPNHIGVASRNCCCSLIYRDINLKVPFVAVPQLVHWVALFAHRWQWGAKNQTMDREVGLGEKREWRWGVNCYVRSVTLVYRLLHNIRPEDAAQARQKEKKEEESVICCSTSLPGRWLTERLPYQAPTDLVTFSQDG